MTQTDNGFLPFSRTALVLSAGAMFGAYQAGAWKALAPRFAPDVVVGASIGSLNGWAIAGGIHPDQLIERWMQAEAAGEIKLRWPDGWLEGFVSVPHLEGWIREMHTHFTPNVEYGVVLTRIWPPGPELVRAPGVTWQHLASSCAMPLLFPHYRLNGAVYTDGGLMQALPLWAMREFRCNRVIAVNCIPTLPFPGGRILSRAMRAISRHEFSTGDGVDVLTISPKEPLGSASDFMRWKRENIERWIAQGFRDARAALEANADFPLAEPDSRRSSSTTE